MTDETTPPLRGYIDTAPRGVTIRGREFRSIRQAALHYGMAPMRISVAREQGQEALDALVPEDANAQDDADGDGFVPTPGAVPRRAKLSDGTHSAHIKAKPMTIKGVEFYNQAHAAAVLGVTPIQMSGFRRTLDAIRKWEAEGKPLARKY